MSSIQTASTAKQFLLHRYIHNLQYGVNCLNTNVSKQFTNIEHQQYSAVIRLPYTVNEQSLTVYAHSIDSPAWQGNTPSNFPILLSDKGSLLRIFSQSPAFKAIYLNVWQLLICDKFNAILDLQAPSEIHCKYDYMNGSSNFNITSLAHYQSLDQRLCSFISFMITAKDAYDNYFQMERV